MVLRALAAAVLLAALATAEPAQAAGLFNPTTHTLPNGMRVVVIENHRAPVVLHMLWYKVGSADETATDAGVAHFLEHMMFKGTRENPEQDYSAEIAALGGEDNAFTSYDYTAFFARIHPNQLETVMQMEAARITGLDLDLSDIAIEQGVVQQERAQRMEATAEDRFSTAVNAAFYGTHPYARPVIGFKETIAAYTKKSIRAFFEQHYAPNNAVLIVVGNVSSGAVFDMAERIYGAIPEQPVPPRIREGAVLAEPSRIIRTEPEVQQPQLHMLWPAPSAHQNSRDSLAIQVLTEVLLSPDGVLQQDLIYKNSIATALDIDYDSDRLNGSALAVSALPRDGTSIATLEKTLLASWHRALQNITEADVTRAKQRLLDTAALARDSLHTPAYVFGMALTTGQTIAEVEQWPKNIASISVGEVKRAAKLFAETPRLTAQLLPTPNPSAKGRKK